MATLPRYQNLGVQYADLPKVSTAAQQAQAQGFDALSRSLDRMSSYFQSQAETEAKKQAKKYAIENPPTQDQLDLALQSGQAPKISGAGSIFQEEYDRLTAYSLSTELGLEAKSNLARMQALIDAGEPVDHTNLKTEIDDMVDGYSSAIMAFDPERSLQFRASLVESSRNVFKSATEAQIKRVRRDQQVRIDGHLRNVPTLIRSALKSFGEINVDTGKPVDVNKKIEELASGFAAYDRAVEGADYLSKFYEKRDKEVNQFLAETVMDDEFASNDMERQRKLAAGDFGKKSVLWNGLSAENKKAVMEAVSAKIEFKSKTQASFLAQEQFTADAILRKIYMAPDVGTQRGLFKQLEGTAASPSTISAARNHIDANASDGPKYDDLDTIGELNRKVQAGTATVTEVDAALRSGQITRATARTFTLSITDPKPAVTNGIALIRGAVNIQQADLPPDIENAAARAIAVKIYNEGSIQLRTFANTPNEKRELPTRAEIEKEAQSIAGEAKSAMLPVFAPVLEDAKRRVTTFLPNEFKNINLENEQEFKAAIASMARKKVNQDTINILVNGRKNYLNLLKLVAERTPDANN